MSVCISLLTKVCPRVCLWRRWIKRELRGQCDTSSHPYSSFFFKRDVLRPQSRENPSGFVFSSVLLVLKNQVKSTKLKTGGCCVLSGLLLVLKTNKYNHVLPVLRSLHWVLVPAHIRVVCALLSFLWEPLVLAATPNFTLPTFQSENFAFFLSSALLLPVYLNTHMMMNAGHRRLGSGAAGKSTRYRRDEKKKTFF